MNNYIESERFKRLVKSYWKEDRKLYPGCWMKVKSINFVKRLKHKS